MSRLMHMVTCRRVQRAEKRMLLTATPSAEGLAPHLSLSLVGGQFSWVPLPCCSPPGCPFPVKSLALSARVSSDSSFPSVRQEPSFRPWKGSAFLQQMVTLVGFLFAETDILTTRGTQGPACLPTDQTQRLQLGPFCPWSPPDEDNWPECPNW